MRYAKAMYLGGDIVKAEECNYESYKKLGIKCSYCNEAVFLCKGEKRRAYFSHYEGKEEECELRINNKRAKEKIEKIEKEAKGQRLEIYNKHLWEIINRFGRKKDKLIDKEINKYFNKILSKREIEELGKRFISKWKEFKLEREDYIEVIKELLNNKYVKNTIERGTILNKDYKDSYFSNIFIKLKNKYKEKEEIEWHIKVSKEVGEYIKTNTSKKLWTKIVLIIGVLASSDNFEEFDETPIKEILRDINNEIIKVLIMRMLVLIDWKYSINYFIKK